MKLRHRPVFHVILPLVVMMIILGGCNPIVGSGQERSVGTPITLEEQVSADQTFTARHAGLQAVDIFLSPISSGDGKIVLTLADNLAAGQTPIESEGVAVSSVSAPGWYRFVFPSQRNSRGQDYLLTLKILGRGSVGIGCAPGDSYHQGAAYTAGQSLEDAQLSFRLIYRLGWLVAGLFREGLDWIMWLLVAAFLFVLPGWGLLAGCLSNSRTGSWLAWNSLRWPEKLGLSTGASMAITAFLMLLTWLIGVQLGPLLAWLPPIFSGLFLIIRLFRQQNRTTGKGAFREWWKGIFSNDKKAPGGHLWEDIVFMIFLGVLIFSRFYVVRSLDYPMWGDSYQHTVITQLILDQGGLFSSWQPYADISTMTYHFGFHSLSAAFAWITGLPAARAVLITGQLLNVFAVLGVYLLASRLCKNPWAGTLAMLLAGFISPMPMAYINWGRYTQLAGQVILPGAILLTIDFLRSRDISWRRLIPIWLVLCGLAITHYVVLIYYILFVIIFWVISIKEVGLAALIKRMAAIGIGAAVLFLPWFLHVFSGKILTNISAQATLPVASSPVLPPLIPDISVLSQYLPSWLWVVFVICGVLGLFLRRKEILWLDGWFILLWFISHLDSFRLPGSGVITSFAVLIFIYLPVSAVVALVSCDGLDRLVKKKPLQQIFVPLIGLIIIISGLRGTMNLVYPDVYSLVTRPDIRAAQWIRENIREDARFLTNSSFAYNDTVIVGTDAGWWLPITAGRKTTTPPLTYASEINPDPDYRLKVNALPASIIAKGFLDPDIMKIMAEFGVTHIYIGQLQGSVNPSGYNLTIDPTVLQSSDRYRLVYHEDRVWIFEIMY